MTPNNTPTQKWCSFSKRCADGSFVHLGFVTEGRIVARKQKIERKCERCGYEEQYEVERAISRLGGLL